MARKIWAGVNSLQIYMVRITGIRYSYATQQRFGLIRCNTSSINVFYFPL
jgi:hypothetical protein